MNEKEEEATKDRFVEYLRRTEGLNYVTVGRHVLARNQSLNFDRLLLSPRGKLALEITTRTPEAEELGNDSKTALVWSELERLIQLPTLSGAFCVRTPSIFPMTKAKLKSILTTYGPDAAQSIRETTLTLSVGENIDICTKLGPFNIRRLKGTSGLYFTGSREDFPGAVVGKFDEIFQFFKKTIKRKNNQLDIEAQRRVLLISVAEHFKKDGLPTTL